MIARVSTETILSTGLASAAGRVLVISGNTVREALRQRFVPFTVLFAIVLVIALSRLRELTFGASELRFIVDVGFGALDLFGAVLTIALTTQLFFSELEHRTLFTLLAKPVSRGEFLLGKFFGVAQVVALFCGILGAVLAAILYLRARELSRLADTAATVGSLDYAALGASLFGQALKLWIVAATTLFVASFARSSLFTLATSFLLCVIGHLQDFAHTAAAHATALGKFALQLALLAGPNFRHFDFSDAVTRDSMLTTETCFRVGAYGAAYLGLFLVGAVWLFRRREF